jgi:3-isopropylmalate/(R)-2-methylmalate dehydratase large subunit
MNRTMAEQILAKHALDGGPVEPGSIGRFRVDFAVANDITAPPAVLEFRKMGAEKVFDPDRCAVVCDHFVPAKDIASAKQAAAAREFALSMGMRLYEAGRGGGVEHAMLPEAGLILPGELVLGADSHSCTGGALGAFATGMGSTDLAAAWALGEAWMRIPETIRVEIEGIPSPWIGGKDLILSLIGKIGTDGARYRTLEFGGSGASCLSMDDRFSMANMAVEAGAKAGLFEPDSRTLAWLRPRAVRDFEPYRADPGARYIDRIVLDAAAAEPLVALPHSPANVRPARECGHLKVDQVFIGSCTNGRLRDLRAAAAVLRGREVAPGVRLIVIPASTETFRAAMEEGLIRLFLDAGAAVSTPHCGPCLGGHYGILAPGERCVATSNRNFLGRMGDVRSEVVLASAMTAAASAVMGRVADPREVLLEAPGLDRPGERYEKDDGAGAPKGGTR